MTLDELKISLNLKLGSTLLNTPKMSEKNSLLMWKVDILKYFSHSIFNKTLGNEK